MMSSLQNYIVDLQFYVTSTTNQLYELTGKNTQRMWHLHFIHSEFK